MEGKIEEELYRKIVRSVPICCTDLIIINRNKILLVKRKEEPFKGKWFIPGGRLYKNEKLEDAAQRIALNETGLRIKIVKKIGLYEFFSNKSKFKNVKGTHSIDIVFLVEPLTSQEVKIDSTSSDFKWIGKIKADLPEFVKKVLEESKIFK